MPFHLVTQGIPPYELLLIPTDHISVLRLVQPSFPAVKTFQPQPPYLNCPYTSQSMHTSVQILLPNHHDSAAGSPAASGSQLFQRTSHSRGSDGSSRKLATCASGLILFTNLSERRVVRALTYTALKRKYILAETCLWDKSGVERLRAGVSRL